MSPWLVAIVALLPAFAVPLAVALRGPMNGRLVAVQLASVLAVVILVLMSFAFDQESSIDLALALVLLSVPGTTLYALFMERWL